MTDSRKNTIFRMILIWLMILLMGSFWLTVRMNSAPVSISVLPNVPREGEPLVVTYKLSNPTLKDITVSHQFYANGELKEQGTNKLSPVSSLTCQYNYRNPLVLGEQVNFVVKTSSALGNHERMISMPSYPPQILSSFSSFSSFSSTAMSYMMSATYYQTTFPPDSRFNLGLIFTIVLIAVLIYLEMSQPLLTERYFHIISNLRVRFGTLFWMLFAIFIGVVYTTTVMIVTNR